MGKEGGGGRGGREGADGEEGRGRWGGNGEREGADGEGGRGRMGREVGGGKRGQPSSPRSMSVKVKLRTLSWNFCYRIQASLP